MPASDPAVAAQIEAAVLAGDMDALPANVRRVMVDHMGCIETPGGGLVPTCRLDLLPDGLTMDEIMDYQFRLLVNRDAT